MNPITLDYVSHPPQRHYSRLIAGICWLVILAVLAVVAFFAWRASRTQAMAKDVEDVELLIVSRTAIGEYHVLSSRNIPTNQAVDQIVQRLASVAKGRREKLQLATVVGELKGDEAALAELHKSAPLMTDPDNASDLGTLEKIYTTGPSTLSSQQRAQLIQRQGWFAKLALTHGLPDSDPIRRELIRNVSITFLCTIIFELALVLAFLAGVALLIITIVRLSLRSLHLCYRPAEFRTTAFLESFALYLAGFIGIRSLVQWLVPHSTFLGIGITIAWIVLAMLWPLARGIRWSELKGALGWYPARGFVREASAGVIGYITGIPLVALAGLLTMFLSKRFGAVTAHPIMFSDTHSPWSILELYLLASVFAPLVEETMFRGALFNHLRQWHGWLISALISSFIFAALHPQGWAAVPVIGSIGFVLASIREWRGTFIASATAHALNNTVVTTLLIIALR